MRACTTGANSAMKLLQRKCSTGKELILCFTSLMVLVVFFSQIIVLELLYLTLFFIWSISPFFQKKIGGIVYHFYSYQKEKIDDKVIMSSNILEGFHMHLYVNIF